MNYVSGECHIYTLALLDLVNESKPFVLLEATEGIIHSLIRIDDGRLLDAKGFVSLPDLKKRYQLANPVLEPITEYGLYTLLSPDRHELKCAKRAAKRRLRKLGLLVPTS